MQNELKCCFPSFQPSSPFSTNVKLKGRPTSRLCQIKPILRCFTNAGKLHTAEFLVSLEHIILGYFSFVLSFLPFSLQTQFMLKLILDRYPLKILCSPIKKTHRMPSGARGIISLFYNVCLKIAVLISWHILPPIQITSTYMGIIFAYVSSLRL